MSLDNTNTVNEPDNKEAPSLTLNDLVIVLQIVQLATSRGALKPEELSTVGNLYDKLVAFLESTGAISRTDPATNQNNLTTQPTGDNSNA